MTTRNPGTLQPATHMVVLKIDGLRLMLPQGDVRALESAADVVLIDPPENGAGWIKYGGRNWPAYCPSGELGFLVTVPAARRACVLLAVESAYFGLLCDDASVLTQFLGQRHDVPLAMRLPESPICGLAMYEDGLACITNAGLLASFVLQTGLTQ